MLMERLKTKLNGYNGSIAATISNKGYRGSTFLSGQQGKLTYSANLMVSRVRQTEQKQRCAVLHLMGHVWTIGRGVIPILISRWVNVSLGYELDSMSNIGATFGLTGNTIKKRWSPYDNLLWWKLRNWFHVWQSDDDGE